MTVYTALIASRNWESTTTHPEPPYQEHIFTGEEGVPIFGTIAIPPQAKGTIISTYGITGDLNNQWFLRLLGRKAYAMGYAVILFDWRAHGKTAELSPTLTSDGLYEGEDFVRIAEQAKEIGCPPQFWFAGYSLGGQLALWAGKAAKESTLNPQEIGGVAVICPSLDSVRSLSYLEKHPIGKYLEQAIARELKKLAWKLHEYHPQDIDPAAIERANSIWGFDRELVISRLGFPTVEAYYNASSGLHLLPSLETPTLIIYAADDPLFDPTLVPDLKIAAAKNPAIDLVLTKYGGHVGYISRDSDPWWAWNRVLEWVKRGETQSYAELRRVTPRLSA